MPEHSSRMEFLHTILRPLIDTYTCSAFNLMKLVGRQVYERDLVQEVLSEIKTNLDGSTISYGMLSYILHKIHRTIDPN